MSSYFLKQPNGKLALFSLTISRITFCDLSEEEARTYGAERWGDACQSMVSEAVTDKPLDGDVRADDGLARWRSTLTKIAQKHGIDGVNNATALLGISDADIPQSALDAALVSARR